MNEEEQKRALDSDRELQSALRLFRTWAIKNGVRLILNSSVTLHRKTPSNSSQSFSIVSSSHSTTAMTDWEDLEQPGDVFVEVLADKLIDLGRIVENCPHPHKGSSIPLIRSQWRREYITPTDRPGVLANGLANLYG